MFFVVVDVAWLVVLFCFFFSDLFFCFVLFWIVLVWFCFVCLFFWADLNLFDLSLL